MNAMHRSVKALIPVELTVSVGARRRWNGLSVPVLSSTDVQ